VAASRPSRRPVGSGELLGCRGPARPWCLARRSGRPVHSRVSPDWPPARPGRPPEATTGPTAAGHRPAHHPRGAVSLVHWACISSTRSPPSSLSRSTNRLGGEGIPASRWCRRLTDEPHITPEARTRDRLATPDRQPRPKPGPPRRPHLPDPICPVASRSRQPSPGLSDRPLEGGSDVRLARSKPLPHHLSLALPRRKSPAWRAVEGKPARVPAVHGPLDHLIHHRGTDPMLTRWNQAGVARCAVSQEGPASR